MDESGTGCFNTSVWSWIHSCLTSECWPPPGSTHTFPAASDTPTCSSDPNRTTAPPVRTHYKHSDKISLAEVQNTTKHTSKVLPESMTGLYFICFYCRNSTLTKQKPSRVPLYPNTSCIQPETPRTPLLPL